MCNANGLARLQIWQHAACVAEMDFACRAAAVSVPRSATAGAAGEEGSRIDLYTLHSDAIADSQKVRS